MKTARVSLFPVLAVSVAALITASPLSAGPESKSLVTRTFEPVPLALKGKGYDPAVRRADDIYPAALRRARLEGSATVRVHVDENGVLTKTEVTRSSGEPLLDQAAMRFARALQFRALSPEGTPRGWSDEIPVTFRLAENQFVWAQPKRIFKRPTEWTSMGVQ